MRIRRFRKKEFNFQPENFKESIRSLHNPYCGWYQIYTIYARQMPDFTQLDCCVNGEDTLALVLFHIGAYRQKPLDDEALICLGEVLRFFKVRNMDVILRIVYDNEGKGMEHEPGTFSRVLEHVDTLGPILSLYSDSIYIFQGLMLGSWGEMHGSKFLSKDYMNCLAEKLIGYLPDTFLAVRRPLHYRMLCQEVPGKRKISLFDDGMFGSPSHMGTFGSGHETDWEKTWDRKSELEFEDRLCRFVPNGGEAVLGDQMVYPYSINETVQRMMQMHVSYLNRVYDERVLSIWKSRFWGGKGEWYGTDGYTYIGRHLGYRFRVLDVEAVVEGSGALVTLTVVNDGFSNCYRKAKVELVLRAGDISRTVLDTDVRDWQSGEKVTISSFLPAAEGQLYLELHLEGDGRRIQLANEGDSDEGLPLGCFKAVP